MLRNILIKNRLIIAFGLMLFLIFLVAYSGYRGINVTSELSLQMLRTDAQIARYAEDVRTVSLGLRRFEKDYFLNMGNVEKQAEYRAKWDERSKKLTETLDNLDKIVTKEKHHDLAGC